MVAVAPLGLRLIATSDVQSCPDHICPSNKAHYHYLRDFMISIYPIELCDRSLQVRIALYLPCPGQNLSSPRFEDVRVRMDLLGALSVSHQEALTYHLDLYDYVKPALTSCGKTRLPEAPYSGGTATCSEFTTNTLSTQFKDRLNGPRTIRDDEDWTAV
jgi:hypothetical protein